MTSFWDDPSLRFELPGSIKPSFLPALTGSLLEKYFLQLSKKREMKSSSLFLLLTFFTSLTFANVKIANNNDNDNDNDEDFEYEEDNHDFTGE